MRYTFEYGGKPKIMGILNVTPDSFSDGNHFFLPEDAVRRALEIEREGADILDIGAQSTRPGHQPISPQTEWVRLEPVLAALKGKLRIPLSVDTTDPYVAARCAPFGVAIINDVSGAVNPYMAEVVRTHGLGWVLTHTAAIAGDAVCTVREALEGFARTAQTLGIPTAQICLDPGIGFGKTMEENALLIRDTAAVKPPNYAYLIGASRKRVIAYLTQQDAPPAQRLGGTLAVHVLAQRGGADILRVHDIAAAVQARNAVWSLFR
jgi:dihydropteroate synthase